MLNEYIDIISRIDERPLWYDQNGVPRYDKFSPNLLSVYWEQAVLYIVKCQECSQEFFVSNEQSSMENALSQMMAELYEQRNEVPPPKQQTLEERIRNKTLHYGDPPRHFTKHYIKYCAAGETMNSIPYKTIEFHKRPTQMSMDRQSIRIPGLEQVYLS